VNKIQLIPDSAGYSAGEASGVDGSGVAGPALLMRRSYINNAALVDVQWTLNPSEYTYLYKAYRSSEIGGNPPFLIDMILDNPLLMEYIAKFVAGSFRLASHTGSTFTVTAKLYVTATDGAPSMPPYPGSPYPVPPYVDPYDCYIEDFDLNQYTYYGGPGGPSPGGFTTSMGLYGVQLNCPTVTNLNYLSIQRAIPVRTPFIAVRCKVKVTSTLPEDACALVLHDGNGYPVGTTLYINPRREAVFDPGRRCTIGYRLAGSTSDYQFFTEELIIGSWYQIEVKIDGPDLVASVQNLDAGTPANVYAASTLPPFIQYSTYDVLIFAQDGPAPAAPAPTVTYAAVQICQPY
jgi:hypothetical protein